MKIKSCSVSQTLKIGKALAKNMEKGDIVGLFGELGSGKTVFTKGIALGLGIHPLTVISPTFILLKEYNGELPLYHFDLYRLGKPEDITALGYEEYLYGQGVSVIEWADRLSYLLPKEILSVRLSLVGSKTRYIEFKAGSSRYKRLIKKIYENIRH